MNQELKEIVKDDLKIRLVAQRAFETIDKDGSGYLDFEEIEKMLKDMAETIGIPAPSRLDVSNAFKEID